jgi:hypothetical protein
VLEHAKDRARTLGGDGLVIRYWGHFMTGADGYGQAYDGKNLSILVVGITVD